MIGPVGVLKIGSLVLLQRLGMIVARVKIQTPAHGKQALIIAHAQKLPALALGDVQIFLHLVVILGPRLAAWNRDHAKPRVLKLPAAKKEKVSLAVVEHQTVFQLLL